MKKVLFVVSTTGRSGPIRQLLNLCRFLPKFGYAPHVLTLSTDPQDSLADDFRDAEIKLHTLGLSRVAGVFLAKSRTKEVVQKIAPHVIHSHGIRSDFICHAVSGTTPHILTLHNYAWNDYPHRYGRIQGGLMAWQHLRLVRKAQRPIACSKAVADLLTAIQPDILSVQNGVDTDEFRPADRNERARLRQSLGLDPNRHLIISVGKLAQGKRPNIILHAFLHSNLSQYADLIFLGDGAMRTQLENDAAGNPAVKYAGRVKNVNEYLQCSDLFVSASCAEGLPNTVMESLSAGLGVVLSDIEPHKEFGVEAAGAGLIAKLDDPEDFTTKIVEMLTHDRTTVSRAARTLAKNEFSAVRMANRYADIYNRLLIENLA